MRATLIELDRRMRRLRLAWLFWALFIGQFALIIVALATLLLSREARLTVEASTQFLSIHVADQEIFDGWGELKPNSALSDRASCDRPTVLLESQIRGPLDIILRTASDGTLTISLEGRRTPLGTIQCGNAATPIESSLILVFSAADAAALSLPFNGRLTLGGDMNTGTPKHFLLLEGTLRVEASSAPFGTGQVVGESRLYTGDRLSLAGPDAGADAIAHGVVTFGDMESDGGLKAHAMRVTAHATAAHANVLHHGQLGATGTSFAPTFWAKLQAQPEWALLVVIVAVLLNMVTQMQTYLVERGMERTASREEERT